MSGGDDVRMDFLENYADYKQYLDMCESQEYQKLQQFYNRKTLFDILGVARQENPHSSFLAWLLDPGESHRMGDFPIKQFLKTACFAYMKYGDTYLKRDGIDWPSLEKAGEKANQTRERQLTAEELKRAAEKKLLFYDRDPGGDKTELRRTLMHGNYQVAACGVQRERPMPGRRRADIFIELTVRWGEWERALIIFIENKVTSGEHDMQTAAYTQALLGGGVPDGTYVIPVYLYVSSNNEMTSASQSKDFPCKSRLFLLLNYQYLMDGVLAPCLTRFSDDPVAGVLRDYIACLGKTIEVVITEDKKSSAAQITMAVGPEEKRWSAALWEKHQAVLKEACQELIADALSEKNGQEDQKEDAEGPKVNYSSRFLTATDADEQFYRTVLNSVLEYLEGRDQGGEDGAENGDIMALRDAIKELNRVKSGNKKPIYYVKQKNGDIWEFVSASRGGSTMGALAYVLLRQYIELNRDKTAEEIRTKLAIKSNWLGSMLVTRDELRDFLTKWANADHSGDTAACRRYIDGGCPLNRKSDPGSECLLDAGTANWQLREAVYGKNRKYYRCWCIYDVVHSFFTGGIEAMKNKVMEQKWEKVNGHELSEFFSSAPEVGFLTQRNFGINKTFGPIEVDGWPDGFAYVARYWGESTIDKLKDALGMGDYVASSRDEANGLARLNFDRKECMLGKSENEKAAPAPPLNTAFGGV